MGVGVMSPKFFTLVEEGIRLVETRMRETTQDQNPDLRAALDAVVSAGGKRIRPAIVWLAGRLFSGDVEQMINLGAAIELLHTATLVHDDLIDGAILRRGNPTLNTQWSPAATVLAGDYLFARAAELAAATHSVQVMQIFARTLSTIVSGEVNQLLTRRGLASREDYFQRIYAKTASLFETAAWTTAILCQQSPGQQQTLKTYGYKVGMAFQIVDDILDFTGEQVTVGKPVASDLRNGLVTLPAILFLEANPSHAAMESVMRGKQEDDVQVTQLVDEIRASGAIESALTVARNFAEQAVIALQTLPDQQERQALIEVAEYVVDREI
jgi:geranylgeranyl pyrophosphate synthase